MHMRPYQHYQRAEELIEEARGVGADYPVTVNELLLEAQVHATLANVGTKISSGDGSI